MKVILFESVDNVGLPGDIAEVKNGYFRNFLLPKGKAVMATPQNIKQLELKRKKLATEAQDLIKSAQGMASKLESIQLRFEMKAGRNGRLFGSVSANDIADALEAKGVEVDRRYITLPGGALKTLGTYTVRVKLHANLAAPITVVVEGEEGDEEVFVRPKYQGRLDDEDDDDDDSESENDSK